MKTLLSTMALTAALIVSRAAQAGIDCGSAGMGVVKNDGCDKERKDYCMSLRLPYPPWWTHADTERLVAAYESCMTREKPSSPAGGRSVPRDRPAEGR